MITSDEFRENCMAAITEMTKEAFERGKAGVKGANSDFGWLSVSLVSAGSQAILNISEDDDFTENLLTLYSRAFKSVAGTIDSHRSDGKNAVH